MIAVPRTDRSILGRWWWTVDHWLLFAIGLLIAFGALMSVAASPPVAERLGLEEYHFVRRQVTLLVPAVMVLLACSLLSPSGTRRLSLAVLGAALVGIAATVLIGAEIKGATRWLHLGGFSLQPSEFAKPAFAVVAAWLFAQRQRDDRFPGYTLSTLLFAATVGLLLLQPDLGMALVLTATWGAQFFLAGLPMPLVVAVAGLAVGILIGSYFLFDHVASRIDRFLDPSSGDSYQIGRSLEAFRNGGLWGTGPGDGTVKLTLPDAHADFVFAVAGEELGALWCLLVVALFAFVVLRGLARLLEDGNLFVVLAAAGLFMQFGLQALINMGSTLHLIPTKGMTLPFVSYGGSSLLALAYGMGMALALTRRRPSPGGFR